MTEQELTNMFKYIVFKCDSIINNDKYKPDTFTQDTVEDIAELCNHVLDGDYGKFPFAEVQRRMDIWWKRYRAENTNSEDRKVCYRIWKEYHDIMCLKD